MSRGVVTMGLVVMLAACGTVEPARSDTSPPTQARPVIAVTATPTADPARACQTSHGLPVIGQSVELPRRSPLPASRSLTAGTVIAERLFGACALPAPAYAKPDGYVEVAVHEVIGCESGAVFNPRTPCDEAAGNVYADRIDAPCQYIEVAYTFASQGGLSRGTPFQLSRGAIVDAYGAQFKLQLAFYPSRSEIVVFHNSKNGLDFVRCLQ